jgi:hypothetical protein
MATSWNSVSVNHENLMTGPLLRLAEVRPMRDRERAGTVMDEPTIADDLAAVIAEEIAAQLGVHRAVEDMPPLIADAVLKKVPGPLRCQRLSGDWLLTERISQICVDQLV